MFLTWWKDKVKGARSQDKSIKAEALVLAKLLISNALDLGKTDAVDLDEALKILQAADVRVSERSERALMMTSILAMNQSREMATDFVATISNFLTNIYSTQIFGLASLGAASGEDRQQALCHVRKGRVPEERGACQPGDRDLRLLLHKGYRGGGEIAGEALWEKGKLGGQRSRLLRVLVQRSCCWGG